VSADAPAVDRDETTLTPAGTMTDADAHEAAKGSTCDAPLFATPR
jgi:hypothetical protein